jgi:PAS domain S-box-containing protein
MEHGACFSWEPGLVWLHVISDIITGIAYYSIPAALFYFAYKRRDLPFQRVILLFGIFILSCGTTHFLAAYTVFVAEYWIEGVVKAFTALISAVAAFYFIPLIPKAIAMPSLTKSLKENQELNAQLGNKLDELNVKTLEVEESEKKNRDLARELTSLINNVPGIVYRGHRDWSLSFIGAEVEPVTGYPPDMFTSGAVGWKEIIHPDDLEQVKEVFRKADKEKADTLRVEYRIRNKDGGIRWISDRRQLVYDAEGNFSFVDGLLLDITERKGAERRFARARIVETSGDSQDLICTHDLEGRLLSVNPWAARVLGYSQGELLRTNMRDMIAPEVRNEFDEYLEKIRKHGAAQGMLLVRTRNGERRIWEYNNTLRTEGVTNGCWGWAGHHGTQEGGGKAHPPRHGRRPGRRGDCHHGYGGENRVRQSFFRKDNGVSPEGSGRTEHADPQERETGRDVLQEYVGNHFAW